MKTQPFALLLLAVGLAAACRRSPMDPGTINHAGNWSGTTSQGTPISFTISSSERVTAISVGYDFSGCSGTRTFTDLNVAITSAPAGLLPPDLQQFSGFSFRDGAEGAANATQVAGALKSETTASGAVSFESYAGCTDTFKGATWNASKNP
jgi:hypothetical protein